MEQGTQGQGEPLFSCRIDNAKVVTATLTCLSNGSKKDQLAQVEVNEDGKCEDGREGGIEEGNEARDKGKGGIRCRWILFVLSP